MKNNVLLTALISGVFLCGCNSSESGTVISEHNDIYISKLLSSDPDPKYKDIYYFNCKFVEDNNKNRCYNYDMYYSGENIEEYPYLIELSSFWINYYLYTEEEFLHDIVPENMNPSELEDYKNELIDKIANKGGNVTLYYKNQIIAKGTYELPDNGNHLEVRNIKYNEFNDEQYRHIFDTYEYYVNSAPLLE